MKRTRYAGIDLDVMVDVVSAHLGVERAGAVTPFSETADLSGVCTDKLFSRNGTTP